MTVPMQKGMAENKSKMKLDRKAKQQILRIAAHVGSLSMLAVLIWRYYNNDLTADPVRFLLLQTGEWSLGLLVLSLAITPVVMLTGWKQIMPWRRIFGVYAVLYVFLHLMVFAWLDYGLNWDFIVQGIAEQNFVLVGFLAFVLLLPLAITSNKWSMRKLGKKWKTLHKLVFVIIVLALIHFFWLVKNVYYVPILYASVVAVLLLLRWKPVKQRASGWQRRMRNRWRKLSANSRQQSVDEQRIS